MILQKATYLCLKLLRSSLLQLVIAILCIQLACPGCAMARNSQNFPKDFREYVKTRMNLTQYKASVSKMFSNNINLSAFGRKFQSIVGRKELRDRYVKVYKEKIAPTTKTLSKNTLQETGQLGQTILILMAINVIESVNNERKIALLSGDEITSSEFTDLVSRHTAETIERSEIIGGIAGATAVKSGQYVLKKSFQRIIGNQTTKSAFTKLLGSAVLGLLIFIGWEVVSQLVAEARNMIVDNEDYRISEFLFTASWNDHRRNELADMPEYQHFTCEQLDQKIADDQKRVRGMLIENMKMILFSNPILRNRMLYNAWRLRLATGDFITLFLSMIGGSIIGTAVGGTVGSAIPGVGTIVVGLIGFVFGVLGGILGYYIYKLIPETWKDEITNEIKWARRRWNEIDMQIDLYMILPYLISDEAQEEQGWNEWEDQWALTFHFLKERREANIEDCIVSLPEIAKTLERRIEARENILNVYFEMIYAHLAEKQLAEIQNQMATQTLALKDTEALQNFVSIVSEDEVDDIDWEISKIVSENIKSIEESTNSLNELRYEPMRVYDNDRAEFATLMDLYCEDQNHGRARMDNVERELIEDFIKRSHFMHEMMSWQYHGILPEQSGYMQEVATEDERVFIQHSVLAIVETGNFRGFKEEEMMAYYEEY